MRIARSLLVAVVTLAGLLAPPAVAAQDDAWVSKENRDAAPTLALRDLSDRKRQLSQLTGKVVVVNFWATWCAPCRAELGEFAKVYADYRARGVEFIGAANERRSSKRAVQEFVRGQDVQFPIWLEASVEHMEQFGLGAGLPATVVVDPQGRVAARIKGVTTAEQLRALLDRLLLESSSATSAAVGC